MKTATMPPLRVDPELRSAAESVLANLDRRLKLTAARAKPARPQRHRKGKRITGGVSVFMPQT